MVDVKQHVLNTLTQHFMVDGDPIVDPAGKVSVMGDVVLYNKSYSPFQELPVKFSHIEGSMMLSINQLKTLEGCPETVGKNFECDNNELKSLKFGPKIIGSTRTHTIGGSYNCSKNQLKDLEGAPREIPSVFNCSANPLESLQGFPQKIGDSLYITYDTQLPLLRTLVAPEIIFWPYQSEGSDAWKVLYILEKYLGQGKRAMFDCQKELEDAGFEDNARW